MNTCPCCGQPVPNEVMVSLDTNTVSRNGDSQQFPPQTAEVLHALSRAYPGMVEHGTLVDVLYGRSAEQTSERPSGVIRVLISHARKPLARMGIKIVPVYGDGYRMALE